MSLIKKEDLIERVERYIIGCPIYSDKTKSFVKEILETEIKYSPAIDPVKHGHWIDDGDCFICSNCRKAFGFLSAKCVTNFCPYCGAKMESDKNDIN